MTYQCRSDDDATRSGNFDAGLTRGSAKEKPHVACSAFRIHYGLQKLTLIVT